jgi:hypothetical protein
VCADRAHLRGVVEQVKNLAKEVNNEVEAQEALAE